MTDELPMTAQTERIPRYRMPAVFGPAPGPRQKADGTPWTAEEAGTTWQEWASVTVRARRDQLEAILPPGFALRGEPELTVRRAHLHDLYWLAGRGYGLLDVTIPTTYTGRDETVEGDFIPVIFEGLPDAIITGRDELGFPKLPGDLPDIVFDEQRGTLGATASWFGFRFFELALSRLTEQPADAVPAPTLTYKYVPRTSVGGQGGADVAVVTTGAPLPGSTSAPPAAPLATRRWAGAGTFAWHRATFEQLPTTVNVVNGLAGLEVLEVLGASYTRTTLPGLAMAGDSNRTLVPAEEYPPDFR